MLFVCYPKCSTCKKALKWLDEQGVFTSTYRLIDSGAPVYANMKLTRMPGGNRIIMGISIIDAQMRQREQMQQFQQERDTLARVMALSEDYLSLYSVDPETGAYVEYSASDDYASLGFGKAGEDFFTQGIADARRTVYPADLNRFLERFNRENVLREIRENGVFKLQYRLVIHGQPRPVTLKIARFQDGGETKLVAGLRAWRVRR